MTRHAWQCRKNVTRWMDHRRTDVEELAGLDDGLDVYSNGEMFFGLWR